MKRILTLLIIVLSVAQLSAQRNLTEHRPVWFGVNMGGTWQTSDMKPVGGIGWGFTVARYSRISSPSPLYWGWRFRFLDGRNFGYNYHALQGITNNPVLSPYYSNTDPDTGFVYSNYKMRLDEFAGEIIIGSNTLRKHGVLLYGWGGVGMTYWKTTTDLQDISGNYYNYSTITDNGNQSAVEAQLDAMWDKEYETNANGSSAGQWSFMPSAGIGLGYQWSNFSIAMEHKTTWALTDFIDGTNNSSSGPGTSHVNDIYHYDGLTFKWNFHNPRNDEHNDVPPPPPAPNPTSYNQQQPNQPLPTSQPTQSDPTPNQNSDPSVNNIPASQPPTVTFTVPSTDPYTATSVNQNLTVKVTGVNTKAQISLTINGQVSTDYTFNTISNMMTFSHTLQPGSNVYRVIATNNMGSAQDQQTIIYKQGNDPNPNPTTPPPTVVITSPSTDPYTSTTQTYTVTATTTNVAGAADVKVTRNGSPVTNFTFDPRSKVVSFVTTLSAGNNSYVITGTNSVGSASDAVTIVYGNANTVQPPVVTITNPSSCPFQTKIQNHTLSANVSNVTQASQVTVVFNGQAITNFNFNVRGSNATVTFPVVLQSGANNFTVTGTNTAGTDSKSCTITYKPQNTPTDPPPTVDITTPNQNPYVTTVAAQTINATVMNVTTQNQITVTKGGVGVPFSFNANTHVVTFNVTLSTGQNVFTVTATNNVGTASDNTTLTLSATPNGNTPVDPQNPGNGQSRPGETTVVPGNSQNGNGGQSRPGETTVVPGNGQNGNGGQSRPGETTVVPGNGQNGNGGQSRPGETTTPGNTVPGNSSQSSGGGRPTGPAPTITLHVPSSSPVTTGTTTFPVTMIVTGVTSQSQITVKVNNVTMTSGVTFNQNSGTLSFTASLNNGANQIVVTATTPNGTATRNLNVGCNATNNRQQQNPTPEPAKSEPKKDEPKKEEPKPVKSEPKKDEPKKDNPKPAPAKAEPKKDEPKKDEPKKEEPKPSPGNNRGGAQGSTGATGSTGSTTRPR